MAVTVSSKHILGLVLLSVICLSCVAAYADEDMVARKAMFFKKSSSGKDSKLVLKGAKDSSKDKAPKDKVSKALLRVSVTLEEGHDTCPRGPEEAEQLRSFVAESFAAILHKRGVPAKIKTGTLSCEADFDEHAGCVKVIVKFIVKLYTKKDPDSLNSLMAEILDAHRSKHAVCDLEGVECSAHGVACLEVEEMSKKPHGTGLHKYKSSMEGGDSEEGSSGKGAHKGKSAKGVKHAHKWSKLDDGQGADGGAESSDGDSESSDGDDDNSDDVGVYGHAADENDFEGDIEGDEEGDYDDGDEEADDESGRGHGNAYSRGSVRGYDVEIARAPKDQKAPAQVDDRLWSGGKAQFQKVPEATSDQQFMGTVDNRLWPEKALSEMGATVHAARFQPAQAKRTAIDARKWYDTLIKAVVLASHGTAAFQA